MPQTSLTNTLPACKRINARAIERLVVRRNAMGFTVKELATRADMTPVRLLEIESGEWSMRVGEIFTLAAALETNVSYFTEGCIEIARAGLEADFPSPPGLVHTEGDAA